MDFIKLVHDWRRLCACLTLFESFNFGSKVLGRIFASSSTSQERDTKKLKVESRDSNPMIPFPIDVIQGIFMGSLGFVDADQMFL